MFLKYTFKHIKHDLLIQHKFNYTLIIIIFINFVLFFYLFFYTIIINCYV